MLVNMMYWERWDWKWEKRCGRELGVGMGNIFEMPEFTINPSLSITFNPLLAVYIWGNIKIYLHFLSFLNTEMVQALQMFPHESKGMFFLSKSVTWLCQAMILAWDHSETIFSCILWFNFLTYLFQFHSDIHLIVKLTKSQHVGSGHGLVPAWQRAIICANDDRDVSCHEYIFIELLSGYWQTFRADSRFAPSQWEMVLICNDVSRWLGPSLESTLDIVVLNWCYEW